MNKKITVTIGIPAFNEEKNIAQLIGDVLSQESGSFLIDKIIISSDGSQDNTVNVVKKISDKRVRIIDNKDRKGIARGLNQILEEAKGNILITLDADIKISDKNFVSKLIKPIIEENADLTSSSIAEVEPTSHIAKTLLVSMKLKTILFDNLANRDNIYTCHGLARAYSRRFYENLIFPVSIGNDMYSYLACVTRGYKYIYANTATAWYRLPETYKDHAKQSLRFFSSAEEQTKYFAHKVIAEETRIPFKTYYISMVKGIPVIIKNPLEVLTYFRIQLRLRRESKEYKVKQAWDTAETSKNI